MATVTIHGGPTLEGFETISTFLAQYGIEYGQWDISAIPTSLLERDLLDPAQKQQILRALSARIDEAKQRAGYQSADVVALAPNFPNLDDIMRPYQKEHYHTENEVRFVVDGQGVFSINPRTAPCFDVSMVAGDFISVPAGTWHWFNLGPDRRIKTVRIFESVDGWAAIYPDEEGERAATEAAAAR